MIPRATLIGELVSESRTQEGNTTTHHLDWEVGSLIYDLITLSESLAERLEGVDAQYESNLLDQELVGKILKRLGDNQDLVSTSVTEFLGKELRGEWDSPRPPAEGASA